MTLNPFLRFIYSRGFRPATLARAADVPLGTIYSISAGHRSMNEETRRRLARALRCRPASIPDPGAK